MPVRLQQNKKKHKPWQLCTFPCKRKPVDSKPIHRNDLWGAKSYYGNSLRTLLAPLFSIQNEKFQRSTDFSCKPKSRHFLPLPSCLLMQTTDSVPSPLAPEERGWVTPSPQVTFSVSKQTQSTTAPHPAFCSPGGFSWLAATLGYTHCASSSIRIHLRRFFRAKRQALLWSTWGAAPLPSTTRIFLAASFLLQHEVA